MKYVKKLGLLGVVVAAVMAFASTASADKMTSPKNVKVEELSLIKFTATDFKLTGAVEISCSHSILNATVTTAGDDFVAGVEIDNDSKGDITALSFTGCANDTVTVLNPGSPGTWEIEYLNGSKGQMKLSGTEITVQLHRNIFGIPVTTHCIYATSNTVIGVIEGAESAKLVANGSMPQKATDGACGSNAIWDGTYSVYVNGSGAPNTLIVDD